MYPVCLPMPFQKVMAVLTRLLLAVSCSTLVTIMLPIPTSANEPMFKLYDEFKQRTSIPVHGGHAAILHCDNFPNSTLNIPLTADIISNGIKCGPTGVVLQFPKEVMRRIAKEGECKTKLDCAAYEDSREDKKNEPQICEDDRSHRRKKPEDECIQFGNGYTKTGRSYVVGNMKQCPRFAGFFYLIAGVKHMLPAGTVVLVTNTTKDIVVKSLARFSCILKPSAANMPQPKSTTNKRKSTISVEQLVEDQLVRVECNTTKNQSVYFFVGRSELKVNCKAPANSKCQAPAWMNISPDNFNEMYEEGVVRCSLKTPMQLCFPLQTEAVIEPKEQVCGPPKMGSGGTGEEGQGGGEGLSAGAQVAIAVTVIALIALIGAIVIAYMFALKKRQQKVEEALLKSKSAKEEEAPVEIDESQPMWKNRSKLQHEYLKNKRDIELAKEKAAKSKEKLMSIDPERLAGLKGPGGAEKKGGKDGDNSDKGTKGNKGGDNCHKGAKSDKAVKDDASGVADDSMVSASG